ncbi:hypothetical protein L596_001620 [Steinernema carpocapsae]|uniref:Uncharacterized protein n=1 Tax=Steinernema carpocapsae TaxID=34508 RepID=A0A4U8ULK8_STECR|nr:hypothetical protein L596_001620 [Steinernema carpocapsae]
MDLRIACSRCIQKAAQNSKLYLSDVKVFLCPTPINRKDSFSYTMTISFKKHVFLLTPSPFVFCSYLHMRSTYPKSDAVVENA